jgi:hypothetical protein
MLALTVRQPWAWAIIHAGKDVENRSWPTEHRGPLAVHAGKAEWRGDAICLMLDGIVLPPEDELIRGAVIGIVDVVDCVRNHDSPWADDGQYHWVLHNPRALSRPMPLRGQQGLFAVSIPGSYITTSNDWLL